MAKLQIFRQYLPSWCNETDAGASPGVPFHAAHWLYTVISHLSVMHGNTAPSVNDTVDFCNRPFEVILSILQILQLHWCTKVLSILKILQLHWCPVSHFSSVYTRRDITALFTLRMGCIEISSVTYVRETIWRDSVRHHNDALPEMAPAPILSCQLGDIAKNLTA